MKKYFTYTLALFFATLAVSFAQADKAAIEAKENAAWQAYKDKKADEFKKVVDKDLVAIHSAGISDLNKEIADMAQWDMKSFKISDFKAFSDEKDVVVTSYTVKLEATVGGKDASGTYNAGSVWKLENGQWLAIFHSNVKQEK
jgi:hypothetical protein